MQKYLMYVFAIFFGVFLAIKNNYEKGIKLEPKFLFLAIAIGLAGFLIIQVIKHLFRRKK